MAGKEILITRSGGISEILADSSDKAIEYFINASNDIAFALIKFRKANNLTQADLAVKLGVSQAMVSKLESCEYNFTIELLSNICAKLNWTFRVISEPLSLTVQMQDCAPITMKALKIGETTPYYTNKRWSTTTTQAIVVGDGKIA